MENDPCQSPSVKSYRHGPAKILTAFRLTAAGCSDGLRRFSGVAALAPSSRDPRQLCSAARLHGVALVVIAQIQAGARKLNVVLLDLVAQQTTRGAVMFERNRETACQIAQS